MANVRSKNTNCVTSRGKARYVKAALMLNIAKGCRGPKVLNHRRIHGKEESQQEGASYSSKKDNEQEKGQHEEGWHEEGWREEGGEEDGCRQSAVQQGSHRCVKAAGAVPGYS
jgi:hypothetical protein